MYINLQIENDPGIVGLYVAQLIDTARTFIELHPTVITNDTGAEEFYNEHSCPNICTGHGTCRNGESLRHFLTFSTLFGTNLFNIV